ncbi:MAG: DNA gyrase subunit A, partial [Bdellovibrionaceae bacterium]|nr:DNA gyrase subunit A [Pseudobdellovibrionaceae bacterium]MDW8191247.1 DNA gyrase C-terminal beta-propeller domain-containing protein [Pseudobdellovibrionaceae bacterium]
LRKALDHIDEIVQIIKTSNDATEAEQRLIAHFDYTERQVKAILEMRLQRLTGLERDKIDQELAELAREISRLTKILSDTSEVYKVIIDELIEIKKKFGDERRTKIERDTEELADEDLIADESMVVMMTNTGYIKRISTDEYRSQKRGGRGMRGMETREDDYVENVFTASTKTSVLFFTDKGKVYSTKVYMLPLGNRQSRGRSIANVIKISGNEKIKAVLPVPEFSENRFVVMITKKGYIKKTPLSEFSDIRQTGMIALTTDLDDQVIDVKISSGNDDIFVVTREGMSIRFDELEVRSMGRAARGVHAISLTDQDSVVSLDTINKQSKDTILLVTEKGFGKRTNLDEYRVQGRNGVGVITLKTTEKTGLLVGAKIVRDHQDIILTTNSGQLIRTDVKGIAVYGRMAQGVKLISLQPEDSVVAFAVVDTEDSGSDENGITPNDQSHQDHEYPN